MQHIDITIGKDGSAKVEALGFTGAICEEFVEKFVEGLGTLKSSEDKPEKYINETVGINS